MMAQVRTEVRPVVTLEFRERSRGLGVPVPRRASLDALLRYAWDAEVFTAGDALAATGLSRSTTIEAIDDLVELGLVRELANARAGGDYRKGRPSRRFELRADAAVVVGVDAGQGHLVTTVADLRGRSLATRREVVGEGDDSAARRRELVVRSDRRCVSSRPAWSGPTCCRCASACRRRWTPRASPRCTATASGRG